MKGIFCTIKASSNEEYKKIIEKRMVVMAIVMIIGIIMFALTLWAENAGVSAIPEKMLGVYSGAGMGIAVGCMILIIKNSVLLKNENKIKESRLKNTDERLRQISDKALRSAVIGMIGIFYAVALIGGIFVPVLIQVLLLVMAVFLTTYVIAYKIYESKM